MTQRQWFALALVCGGLFGLGKSIRIDDDEILGGLETTIVTTTMTTTGSSAASSGTAYRRLTCAFNASIVEAEAGHYQEPSRQFSEADWAAIGLKPSASHNQTVRIQSLTKLYRIVPEFFKQVLPNVQWWVSSGSLIATIRSGTVVPWDYDGDLGVDTAVFDTDKTWAFLNSLPGVRQLHSEECIQPDSDYGGRPGCIFVPFPKSVDPSQTTGFGVHSLPSNATWLGRFIDLETGFFVEIINDGPQVKNISRCSLNGVMVNVPSNPVQYLVEQGYDASDLRTTPVGQEAVKYIGTTYDGSTCAMEICLDVQEDVTKDASLVQRDHASDVPQEVDPFNTAFVQPASQNISDNWEVADPAMRFKKCKDIAFDPNEPVFVRAACFG